MTLLVPTLDGGGTERAILQLSNHWAYSGKEVHLILFRRKGVLLEELHPDIILHSLESDLPWVQVWRLARLLREIDAGCVLSALNPANLVAVCARVFARLDVGVIASVQNHMGAKYQYSPSALNPLRKSVVGWVLRRANRVVAVSEMIRDYLVNSLSVDPGRVTVIYNATTMTTDEEHSTWPRVEHPFFQSGGGPVLIAAGRMARQKNFQLLMHVMTKLPEEIRLIVLGEGEERTALEDLIVQLELQGRVSLSGFQAVPKAWFAKADCFVMTSDWEGFPFVLIEAMSVGLPIVSTDCPSGPRELLAGGQYGRLAKPGDAMAVAAEIEMELKQPCDREKLKQRAKEFSVDRIAPQYEALLSHTGKSGESIYGN